MYPLVFISSTTRSASRSLSLSTNVPHNRRRIYRILRNRICWSINLVKTSENKNCCHTPIVTCYLPVGIHVHDVPSLRSVALSVFEFEDKDDACQREGDKVGDDDWPGVDVYPIDEPEKDAGSKNRQHDGGYISGRLCSPGLRELGKKGSGRQNPCR